MSTVAMEQRKKIHPHKLTLWMGIGAIVMMFAGLTSAYIVKRNQAGWVSFNLPVAFWYSTAAMVLSSLSLVFAGRAFREREMPRYRGLITVTVILGVLFIVLQVLGFKALWASGITLQGQVSYSFLYVIVMLHGAHVLGGLVALALLFLKAYSKKNRIYTSLPVELASTYWHFVDLLWLYLLVFLLMIR
jgi:cytochrome c oxidase subunit III